jgi:hypothetical protein
LKNSALQIAPLEALPASKLSSMAKLGLADRNPLLARSLATVMSRDKRTSGSGVRPSNPVDEFIGRVQEADISKRIMAKQLETSIQLRKFKIKPADRVDSLRGFIHQQTSDSNKVGSLTPITADHRFGRRGGEFTLEHSEQDQQTVSSHLEASRSRIGITPLSREIKNLDPYDCWAGSKVEYLKNKKKFESRMVI